MLRSATISTKLGGGFAFFIIALILVGGIGFISISDVKQVVVDVSHTHVPLLRLTSEVDALAAEQELSATRYALHKDPKFVAGFDELNQKVDHKFNQAKLFVKADQELVAKGWLAPLDKMAEQHDVFVKACRRLFDAVKAKQSFEELDPIADEMFRHSEQLMFYIDGFLTLNEDETRSVSDFAVSRSSSARRWMGIVGAITIVFGITGAVFITRSINGPIKRAINALNEGAEQVASAADQVALSSQSLAEGSSQQAATIEETSASLEEMATMTEHNADHAAKSDRLMKESNQIIARANGSMLQLTSTMEQISAAGEETRKLLKRLMRSPSRPICWL